MEGEAVTRRLGANLALAQALGIQGTPAFVAGDRLFPGVVPADQLREALLSSR